MAVGVINFPTSLDDLDTLIRAENNAITTLASGITNVATTIPLVSAAKFTTSGIATIIDNPASPTLIEIFTYTGKSANDLTGALRGQYGTTASAFSAGATVVMRPVARHHIALVEALIEIEKKIGYSAAVLRPLDVSGTNQPGNNYDITGGAGTGNGIPGIFGVRFPLIGASGTALQALSANRYPPEVKVYTNTGAGTAIANSVVETSLFTGLSGSAGSTTSMEAGINRVGSHYRVRVFGNISTTGTPTLQVKAKLGATTIVDTTAGTLPTINGKFWLDLDLEVFAIGATGSMAGWLRFDASSANIGAATITTLNGASGGATVDLTAAQTLDITITWGTASPSNSIQVFGLNIKRIP